MLQVSSGQTDRLSKMGNTFFTDACIEKAIYTTNLRCGSAPPSNSPASSTSRRPAQPRHVLHLLGRSSVVSAPSTETFRHFVGAGLRLVLKPAHNAVLRADYGVDLYALNQRGLVLGFGQYF